MKSLRPPEEIYSPFVQTASDYSEAATVHGVSYIFKKDAPWLDRILWTIVFLTALVMAVWLSIASYNHWQTNLVTTNLARTTKSVTDLEFPSVTVCNQGLHTSHIIQIVLQDFELWKGNNTSRTNQKAKIENFLFEIYGYDLKREYSLVELIELMLTPDADTTVGVESFLKTVKKRSSNCHPDMSGLARLLNKCEDENSVNEIKTPTEEMPDLDILINPAMHLPRKAINKAFAF